jgi:23S rRNA pseudouridine1911/1915/1917 synthase
MQSTELPVLFCDRYMLVLNKPAGLLSEDDRYSDQSVESMAPELLASLDEKKTDLWLVHRLDAGTSGVLIMARTPMASGSLGKAFHDKQAKKTYWALCQGTPEHATFEVDGPMGRLKGTQHGVIPSGRPALTLFRVISAKNGFCWIEAMPETGRTHQIRVHLAHVGLPILGDKLYGGMRYIEHDGKRRLVSRPMLHARRLCVQHPKSGEKMTFEAPMPDDFHETLSLVEIPC